MSAKTPCEFSAWRAFIWPIHSFELKKVLPMLLLFFFITFNYTILRDTKDTLIVTSAGAEALPFIKVWGTMPAAVLFMLAYTALSNRVKRENLFYITISFFLFFFIFFAGVLYPNRNSLCPHAFSDTLDTVLPQGLHGLVQCIRYWPYTLFDILAELWGSAVLSLLFWGFANDITKISEAKRFYALFGIGANLSLLVSGPFSMLASNIRTSTPPHIDAWQRSLTYITISVVIAGITTMAVYWWIHRYVLTDSRLYDPQEARDREARPHLSIRESMVYLASSKYVLCLAAIVVCYGIGINLLEVTWKNQLRLQYPDPNDYNTFMGLFSTVTGLTTLFMMLFVGGNVLRRSWKLAALLTPSVLAITGVAFFSCILFQSSVSSLALMFGSSPLWLAVVIGFVQNVLCKASKYSLLDPCKEMAYIPLDPETKVKGKAIIDLVGSRLGKSGGSLTQQVLLLFLGTLGAITPYIAITLFVCIGLWMSAVCSLSTQFDQLSLAKTGEHV